MATLSQVDLLDMAREVLQVCQDDEYDLQDIIADLTVTKSAQVTINRIFDGEFIKKRGASQYSSELPLASELFRSTSSERLPSPRSQTVTSRSRPALAPKPTPTESPSSNVVVILSSDEEDNFKPANPFDDSSDTEDGFDELMKNIHFIKSGEEATPKRTNVASSAGASIFKPAASTPLSPRRRTALSPPLILSHRRSPAIEPTMSSPPYRELSPAIVARPTPRKATTTPPTATRTNGLKTKSVETTPTKRNNSKTGALASEFTDKMPSSLEICPEWDDPPFLPESPSPPPKSKSETPTKAQNHSWSPVVKARSPSPTPPYSPSKRGWALSRSPSPGFMARLSNNDSPYVGTSSKSTTRPVLVKKQWSPSTSTTSLRKGTDEKKVSPLPSEDDLLPRTREFNAISPVSRYSDAAWLQKVKAEKRTDRVLGEEKSIWLDDDEDVDEGEQYGVQEFKRSTSVKEVTNGGATDVFNDASPNEWSKYEHLVNDALSSPRTFKDDDDNDFLRALDADDDWRPGNRKRSRNNAGLPVSPSTKDLNISKQAPATPTKVTVKSGTGASSLTSSELVVAEADRFDVGDLDEYRNDPIVLDDDDLTGDHSVEKQIERRRNLRLQQGKKATLKGIDSLNLENMDDLSMMAKSRQRNGKANAVDSDLEFDAKGSVGEDGSDTGALMPLTAKERKKEEARLKREAARKRRDEEKAVKDAEKADRDLAKALERSEKEAAAAERRAKGQSRENEAQRKKREREEARQARVAEAEAAKQAERELNAANRLVPKSQSVKEMVLCMEESMFDSELGKALQTYLQAIECHIDLLKSPVSGAIAVAAAAAANASSRPIGESSSSTLSDLNGTYDACPVRDLIFWRRIITKRYDEQKGVDEALPEEEHTVELESYWLCHMTAAEFCKKIKDNELHRFLDSVSRDMRTRMKRQKAKQEAMGLTPTTNEDWTRRQRVIFMIMGLSAHFRGLKTMTTRMFQEAVRANMQREYGGGGGTGKAALAASARDNSEPDEDRINKELLRLQLEEDCLIIHTDDYDESAQMIVSLTEQLGQRPYKTGRKTGLNVCVDGIKSGVGYKDTWELSLEQIHMVTPQAARSIVAVYPTIRSLYEGYRRCASVYDAWSMLEGIPVLNRTSVIGKTISRRVYDVFMGEDPEAGETPNKTEMSSVTRTTTVARTLLRISSTAAAQIHTGPMAAIASACTASVRRSALTTATVARRSTTAAAAAVAGSRHNFTTSARQFQEQPTNKGDTDKAATELATRELPLSPYGGRFGVPEQPMSTKSIAQAQANNGRRSPFSKAKEGVKNKVNDWTDEKKNLEKRKELLHDFQSGYFAEFSELSKTGSKLWKATPSMINADKALYMPNIIGTSLKTSESVELVDLLRGKISLVAISGTRFGEEHIESYMTPFLKRWPMTVANNSSKVQLVELNIQENPLKAGLVRMMVPFVKKTIPEERHANYVLHYKSIKHLKDPLSMQNSYLGYVFLVDSNCKIRWGAHGPATEAEVKTLLESVQKLSERGGR
ncbi:Mitochondrial ATPase complex subunit atp10 [Linnemannia schmuckeri]|uniref:Mitochondrial ATPase complex subunit atp10 n=1 Tax=Linnemannia schmuckeri TaxID=64567 RepID=A0A9P5S3Y5_9FUNG|nr:Mitochondrial ATPase complex subunit atp10 [Linnemannia schmuckeri]